MGQHSLTTGPTSTGRYMLHAEGWSATASSRGLSPHCTMHIRQGKGSLLGRGRRGDTDNWNHCMALRNDPSHTTFGRVIFVQLCRPCSRSACTFALSAPMVARTSFQARNSQPSGDSSQNPTPSLRACSPRDTRSSSGGKPEAAKIETRASSFHEARFATSC